MAAEMLRLLALQLARLGEVRLGTEHRTHLWVNEGKHVIVKNHRVEVGLHGRQRPVVSVGALCWQRPPSRFDAAFATSVTSALFVGALSAAISPTRSCSRASSASSRAMSAISSRNATAVERRGLGGEHRRPRGPDWRRDARPRRQVHSPTTATVNDSARLSQAADCETLASYPCWPATDSPPSRTPLPKVFDTNDDADQVCGISSQCVSKV